MCYNESNSSCYDKCRVNICSSGNGWNENLATVGEIYSFDGAAVIKYKIDGDECVLTYKDGTVTQIRRGMQCIRLEFAEGCKTSCVIGEDGLSGSYEILTRRLKFFSGKGGCRLTLNYISGTDGEEVSLSLTAAKIRQEKK